MNASRGEEQVMKKFIVLGMVGLLVSASTALGIAFSENWDSYGAVPAGPWVVDPHNSAAVPVTSAQSLSADNSLHIHGGGSDKGIYALINTGGGGLDVGGTDANPLAVQYSTYFSHNRVHRDTDYLVELSLGDVHAPPFALLSPLPNPIAVIAYSGPRFDKKSVRYFDGQEWFQVGDSGVGGVWDTAKFNVLTSTVQLIPQGAGAAVGARKYLGAFDRINIHVEDDSGTNLAYLDDLSVTGGVFVPEPVSLMLLGIGGLMLMRRRR